MVDACMCLSLPIKYYHQLDPIGQMKTAAWSRAREFSPLNNYGL